MEVVSEVRVSLPRGVELSRKVKKKSFLSSGETKRTLERFAWFRNGHRSCG